MVKIRSEIDENVAFVVVEVIVVVIVVHVVVVINY